ncbi:MAG: hypothetical protein LBI10_12880, partial [Deltaproteobacteria bacterium]|nr:hypothetical protein [Deltaproteobacteria bacterium]
MNCSLEALIGVKDKIEALTTIVSEINDAMKDSFVACIKQKAYSYNSLPGMSDPNTKVKSILQYLCHDLDKPLVVFFDEADSLSGPGLITFLTQIRKGFNSRGDSPNAFPSSLALVGMRDIRDYLASNHPDSVDERLANPFNIVTERLTLANFTEKEIGELYGQHTAATGQKFSKNALERAWYWSEGQPWLVNALARQTVVIILNNDYKVDITAKHIDRAAQDLII